MSYKIHIQNMSSIKNIPAKTLITLWITSALNSRVENAEITVRIVDEEESAQLNLRYRQKNGPTNVLSFPYNNPEGQGVSNLLIGDLVICAPLVLKEAASQNKSIESHWAHLSVHGSLHLLGYDHVSEEQASIMENLEINILQTLGFNNPYITTENSVAEQINEK